jgi:ubiquitin-associated SH3 domain-containing protein
MTAKLIVYACPTGLLAQQLDAYFAAALSNCGPNAAHAYMAHCTLTGFFHDLPETIGWYAEHLTTALHQQRSTRPTPPIRITGTVFNNEFHGLLLDSPWVKQLSADFASRAAASPTRHDPLRLKAKLHLSLAYGFALEQHKCLADLAHELVDPLATVDWELRLYQHHHDASWTLHAAWAL